MLKFLLDEQISPEIAEQVTRHRPDVAILAMRDWRQGEYMGGDDCDILRAATPDGFTLVTYDRTTVTPILTQLATENVDHAGVLFVDDKTAASNNFGRLVGRLIVEYDREQHLDWRNRIQFLTKG